MVGRAAELASGLTALAAVAAGTPQAMIISGEAGIGKTRLVRELASRARADGFVVATGVCSPVSGGRLPYGPVSEMLAHLVGEAPELPSLASTSTWQALGPLRMEAPGTSSDSGLAATRLYAAVVDLLLTVSGRHPTMLVVEDVHWVDQASMDLLAFTARRLRQGRVLLVLTVRPERARTRSPDRSALAELRRLPSVHGIELAALSADAVRELVRSVPDPPSDHQVARITDLAQGIPFFALHLARHDADEIPARLRDVLLSSVDEVTDDQRSLLVLLSVVGACEEPELLVRATAGSAERLGAASRDLVRRGLLSVDGSALAFRHALLREVVVADTLPSERVVAHTAAADFWLSGPAADQPHRAAQLAHHLLESGRHGAALQYALKAARHAGAIWAYEDARACYAGVERIWGLVPDAERVSGVRQITVLCEAATACRWCGRPEDALLRLQHADRLVVTELDRATVAHRRGQVLWATGDMHASLEAYRLALGALPPQADDHLRASLLAALAQGCMATGQARSAIEWAAQAIAASTLTGDQRIRLHASITAAVAQAQLGDVDAAVSGLTLLLPEVRGLDDLELVLRCYGNLTFALGVGCRFEQLAEAAAEGIAAAARYGPVISLASTLISNQVNALVALGRWDEAVRVATDALADLTAEGVAGHLHASLAEVAVARGDEAEADRQLASARAFGGQNPYVAATVAITEADHHLWNHRPAEAAAVLAEALPGLRKQDDALLIMEACWRALRAEADRVETTVPLRRTGPSGARDELVGVARDAAAGTALPVCAAVLSAVEAEADRVDATDRPEQWTAVVAANAALGRRHVQAYGSLRLAVAHLRGQARSRAEVALRAAHAEAVALGAVPLIEEISTVARVGGLRLGPDAGSSARSDAHGGAASVADSLGLTPREREVLAMLMTGATNRMIARALFISERTASVHVSNILPKLGAANRTEAARIALRLNLDSLG